MKKVVQNVLVINWLYLCKVLRSTMAYHFKSFVVDTKFKQGRVKIH